MVPSGTPIFEISDWGLEAWPVDLGIPVFRTIAPNVPWESCDFTVNDAHVTTSWDKKTENSTWRQNQLAPNFCGCIGWVDHQMLPGPPDTSIVSGVHLLGTSWGSLTLPDFLLRINPVIIIIFAQRINSTHVCCSTIKIKTKGMGLLWARETKSLPSSIW